MFRGRTVAVVVPAFNEVDKLVHTVRSIPGFIDHVIVVDDASTDGTTALARKLQRRADSGSGRRGLEVVVHSTNRGVGAAIASGYARALQLKAEVTAVMAGDGQMDPADLPRLLTPVVSGAADYVKGNRFAWPGCWRTMPLHRALGSVVLSLLTRVSSGYWHIFDSQCGYTAASRRALLAINPACLFARYGYPNDLLARLHTAGARVADVPVRPVYGPAWRSGIRPLRVMVPLGFLLLRSWATRMAHLWRRVPPSLPALEEPWSSAS